MDLHQPVLLAAMNALYLPVAGVSVRRLDCKVYAWNVCTDLFDRPPSARFGGCRKHPWSKWWSGGGNFGQLVYRQKELVVMAVTAAVWAPFLIRGWWVVFFSHSGSWWLCASQSCASYPIKSLVFVSRTLPCDSLRVCLVFFLFLKTSPLKMFSICFFFPKMATWS